MTNNDWMILGAMMISMLCGFVAIPGILDFCKRRQLYDVPTGRKVHKSPIPRLGGISFLPSMLLAFVIAVFIINKENGNGIHISLWSLYFLLGLLIIYTTGVIDDIIGLSANVKFLVQLVAAIVLPASGLYINELYGLFGLEQIPFWLGAPITVFIIVFVCNAMNLIDGIDGLSASLSEIALAGFLWAFYQEGIYPYCVLIAGLMGVLVPYLYYNLFGKAEQNRKIFMGDSGSLTLGFIQGFLFVKISMYNPVVLAKNPDLMPFAMSLLVVPTFDVVRVVLHRLRTHRSPFHADKNHIHHKMMRFGLTMHQTLIAIVSLAVFFILANGVLYPLTGFTFIFIFDVVVYTAANLTIDWLTKRKVEEERPR